MARSARRRQDHGQAGPIILVLLLFTVLAVLVFVNNQNPEIRRINLVAQQYADAWRSGDLDRIDYDELSHPDVEQGNPKKIADNVRWIVHDLDGKGELRPEKIEVDRSTTKRGGKGEDLATTRLWVTWKLQPAGLDQSAHYWTYPVTLQERLVDGRWRVVWSPQTVHPAIRHGLVFRVNRALVARGNLLGAGDTPLPPENQPNLAKGVLGAIAQQSTHEQAELADLRARPGDTVGIAGLQDIYDERLAGGARIEVTAGLVEGYSVVSPPQQPLFVGPPETPKPVKLTLDRRTQTLGESALTGITTPATLVVVKIDAEFDDQGNAISIGPRHGELLAVANTPPTGTQPAADYGLSSQQPPGPAFGLASTLALLRSKNNIALPNANGYANYQLSTRIDCSQPYIVDGQVFRNAEGPSLNGVRLDSAVTGGCVTGLARLSADVTPQALQSAAWDLGLATPRYPTRGAPGLLAVGDQLGTPAFHGTVPPTDEEPDQDAVHHTENMIGEGQVLTSPLAMARAAATVSIGERTAVRLILDPSPRNDDARKKLNPGEQPALRMLMSKGVTESRGSAHALAVHGDVHALAGTAGYGTGWYGLAKQPPRQAWCVGFLGEYAFAVLVQNGGRDQAVAVASKFLAAVR